MFDDMKSTILIIMISIVVKGYTQVGTIVNIAGNKKPIFYSKDKIFRLKGKVKQLDYNFQYSNYANDSIVSNESFQFNKDLALVKYYYSEFNVSNNSTSKYSILYNIEESGLLNNWISYSNDTVVSFAQYEYISGDNLSKIKYISRQEGSSLNEGIFILQQPSIIYEYNYNDFQKLETAKKCKYHTSFIEKENKIIVDSVDCQNIETYLFDDKKNQIYAREFVKSKYNQYDQNKLKETLEIQSSQLYLTSYNLLGRKKSTVTLNLGGELRSMSHYKRGRIVKQEVYEKNAESYTVLYEYKHKKLILSTTLDKHGNVLSLMTYDKHGNLLREQEFGESSLKIEYHYVYDAKGNWIECKSFKSTNSSIPMKLFAVEKRKIEYWQ